MSVVFYGPIFFLNQNKNTIAVICFKYLIKHFTTNQVKYLKKQN